MNADTKLQLLKDEYRRSASLAHGVDRDHAVRDAARLQGAAESSLTRYEWPDPRAMKADRCCFMAKRDRPVRRSSTTTGRARSGTFRRHSPPDRRNRPERAWPRRPRSS